jgi:hypothetical protein
LAWYRYRVKSEYCLLGQVDGFLMVIVNGRLENEKVGMSYHTLAIDCIHSMTAAFPAMVVSLNK